MRFAILIFSAILTACTAPRANDGLEQLGEQVLKKKEGIDIQLKPIQEQKK